MRRGLVAEYAAKLSRERGSRVTREEALASINESILRVARNVATKFRLEFGYHTKGDIEHEGVVIALEVLDTAAYDVSRPLENFLHVHVKNRLKNFKRKHFMRCEAPCKCCEAFGNPSEPCRRWVEWNERNLLKQNLMRPVDVSSIPCEGLATAPSAADEADLAETLSRIDEELDPALRADYLRMRAGVAVPKSRRVAVREAVSEILGVSIE